MRTVQGERRLVSGMTWIWSAGTETKGKGKGIVNKGKGKGKGGAADWICKETGCTMDRCNFGWRTHCFGCGCKWRSATELQQARNGAKKQLAAMQTKDEDGFSMTRQQRRKAARKKKVDDKREAEGQVAPEAAVEAQVDDAPQDVEGKDLLKLGVRTDLKLDFKGLFAVPPPAKAEAKSAKEVVAETAACKSTSSLAILEEKVALYTRFVAEAAGQPAVQEHLKGELKMFEKEKTALVNKGVGGQMMVEKLTQLLQVEVTKGTQRDLTTTEAHQKRAARALRLRAVLVAEVAKAQQKVKDFDSGFTELTEKWKEEDGKMAAFHEELKAEWTTCITAANVTAGNSAEQAAAVVEEKTQMEIDEDTAMADELLEAQWDSSKAPKVLMDTEDQKAFLNSLWVMVGEWHRVGRQKVLYRELLQSDSTASRQMLRALFGETFWKAIYGERGIGTEHVVPTQMKHILKEVLVGLKLKVETQAQEAAQKAFKTMGEEKLCKRRRQVD